MKTPLCPAGLFVAGLLIAACTQMSLADDSVQQERNVGVAMRMSNVENGHRALGDDRPLPGSEIPLAAFRR